MKIKGRDLTPVQTTVVIPRQGGDIVIKCNPVLGQEEFDELVKMPEPPMITPTGGEPHPDKSNPVYKGRLAEYYRQLYAWRVLKSLQATEGLEFETVEMDKPGSYTSLWRELDMTFSNVEQNHILAAVEQACGLSSDKIEAATKSFLAGEARKTPVAL